MQNIAILAGNIGQDPEKPARRKAAPASPTSPSPPPAPHADGKVLRDAKGNRLQDTEWHRGKTVEQHCRRE